MSTKSLQKINFLSPGANIDAYIKSVGGIPLLSSEEEKKLAEKLYYEQNLEAAQQLIMSHLRFVIHIAKSYTGYGLPLSDLIQEGNVGLMKAVKRFNPEIGVRLVSFSVHWIKAEIHEFILKNWRIVKIATTKAQRKLFFNLRSAKKKLAWLTNDEINDVADNLGVKPKHVVEMEGRLASQDKSFDVPCDDEDKLNQTPASYIEDNSFNPYKLIAKNNWDKKTTTSLYQAIETLDDRSKDIVHRRWLQENKDTLFDLAEEYKVSAERIRQLEKNAIKKIREYLANCSDNLLNAVT